MITITPHKSIYPKLHKAFPKPPGAARRCLDKYIAALERMLFDALQRGQTPLQRKLNLYSLPLKQLAAEGGQIGPGRVRLHAWLKSQNLELVQSVTLGSNLSGLVSEVRLTPLVAMTNGLANIEQALRSAQTDSDVDQYLDGNTQASYRLFDMLYPDYRFDWTQAQTHAVFDLVPVDIASVKAYMMWLSTQSTLISSGRKALYLRQAKIILAVASLTKGLFYQRKQPSAFGRMYYEGISVQSVNKELRRAMLGNCWEYDIRSSVVAWKMGFARSFMAHYGINGELRKVFPATLSYLEDKADFTRTVRIYTFSNLDKSQAELQTKLLKQAFTAISFGARAHSRGWQNQAGQWTNPALVDILKNPEERDRFLNDSVVESFIKEQGALDDYLVELVQRSHPALLQQSLLLSPSGRPAKAKVVAYLYQHGETEVMDVMRRVAAEHDRVPLANVHDAIFFKRRLGVDLKWEIEHRMRQETGNPYWHLSVKEHGRYEPKSLDAAAYALAHQQWIAQEEAIAKAYFAGRPATYTEAWWAEQDD